MRAAVDERRRVRQHAVHEQGMARGHQKVANGNVLAQRARLHPHRQHPHRIGEHARHDAAAEPADRHRAPVGGEHEVARGQFLNKTFTLGGRDQRAFQEAAELGGIKIPLPDAAGARRSRAQ